MSAIAGSYADFLAAKEPRPAARGLDVLPDLHPGLAPHQRDCVAFGLRMGSSGLFLDTGLGKTFCELEWARHAAAATNGHALILCPLAVAAQHAREADRWGIPDTRVIRSMADVRPGISICNYDRLDALDASAFGAVALDESSILKSFTGKTTRALIQAFGGHRFRLAATATPAPNDHMELGQHAEFLGIMPSNEMLMRWFIADQTQMGRYRLKGHAVESFWDWMASWARMAETPADLGHDGSDYVLPALDVCRHRAAGDARAPAGALFVSEVSATTLHDVKRQTAEARAEAVARVVAGLGGEEACVVWCDTDYEADALRATMPAAIEVRGSMPAERKEDALARFASGRARLLITKPSICGYGLNWQHCAVTVFAGRSFSYEAWYQAIRRFWRFGQKRAVQCHLIVAEGEDQIGRVIARKGDDHQAMKRAMAAAMRRSRASAAEMRVPYRPEHQTRLPAWLNSAA